MQAEVVSLEHVQLAMPVGGEERAERFYCGLLGFERVKKPPALATRGGCWFRRGRVEVHLGVESDFRAAKKAHPALGVHGFELLAAKLSDAAVDVRFDDEMPQVRR